VHEIHSLVKTFWIPTLFALVVVGAVFIWLLFQIFLFKLFILVAAE
jgi:hypothetical protein